MNPYSLSVSEEVSDELGVCVVMTEVYTFATSLFPKSLWQTARLYNTLNEKNTI